MKKVLSLLIVVFLGAFQSFCLNEDLAGLTVTIEGITYSLNTSEHTAAVHSIESSVVEATILETVEYEGTAYTTTSIADNHTYMGCSELKKLSVPGSIKTFNGSFIAFLQTKKLEKVELHEGVAVIEGGAFNECYFLKDINLPSSLTYIGSNAFNRCYSLESVSLPEGITEIQVATFRECFSLRDINFPSSLTYIGPNAFNKCYSLESISLPEGITEIQEGTFRECRSLVNVNWPGSITKIKDYAFADCGFIDLVLPASLTGIGDHAFASTIKLKTITSLAPTPPRIDINGLNGSPFTLDEYTADDYPILIVPDDSRKLYSEALIWNSFSPIWGINEYKAGGYKVININGISYSLNPYDTTATVVDFDETIVEAEILSSVEYEGVEYTTTTFTDYYPNSKQCTQLKKLIIPGTIKSIGTATLFSHIKPTNLETLILHEGIEAIEKDAFDKATNLQEITFPNSLKNLGISAFSHCRSLKSIYIPDGITEIDSWAFSQCTRLVDIRWPKNLISIGDGAFNNCPIADLVLPATIQKLGDCVFESMKIKTVTCLATTPPEGNFDDGLKGPFALAERQYFGMYIPILIVPDGCRDAYAAAPAWHAFRKIYEMSEYVAGIDNVVAAPIAPAEVYDLNGTFIGNSTDGLPSGIYIMRRGAEVSKVRIQ